jgi:hypothetical protein
MALAFCAPARGQDSDASASAPSLGQIARQAQKNKASQSGTAGKPTAKVLTNDDVSSNSGGVASSLGAGLGEIASPGNVGKGGSATTGSATSVSEQLGKLESMLDQVEALDRATLVKNVLQGNDTDFPARAKWEERLLAARETFVSQGRAQIAKLKQMEASAESLKGVQDPHDPRIKEMGAQLQELVRSATQSGAAFQAVMMEGRDLAGQASSH